MKSRRARFVSDNPFIRHVNSLRPMPPYQLRLDAQERFGHWRMPCHAKVFYVLDTGELRLRVNVPRAGAMERIGEAMCLLPWPSIYSGLVIATDIHMEILRNDGLNGFLMRLVRRGYPDRSFDWSDEAIDLVEYVFRIKKTTPALLYEGRSADEIDPVGLHATLPPLTPNRLAELFRASQACKVIFDSYPLSVEHLFYRGLHELRKPTGRKEAVTIIDIN